MNYRRALQVGNRILEHGSVVRQLARGHRYSRALKAGASRVGRAYMGALSRHPDAVGAATGVAVGGLLGTRQLVRRHRVRKQLKRLPRQEAYRQVQVARIANAIRAQKGYRAVRINRKNKLAVALSGNPGLLGFNKRYH